MKAFFEAIFSGLTDKEKKVLYIACAIASLALFDRLVFAPLTGEITKLNEEIRSEINLIKSDIHILQYKDNIVDKYIHYGKYFAQEGLSQEERIAKFLNEIEDSAKKASITLTNINPVNVKEEGADIEYNLTIECLGTMTNFLEFVYAVENSQKMLNVVSYTLSPKNREEYQVKATLTVLKKLVFPLSKDMIT